VGSDGIFVKTNGANEDNIRLLVEETAKKYSRLYYAFNNAGRHLIKDLIRSQEFGKCDNGL
jgi:hypothetical protein